MDATGYTSQTGRRRVRHLCAPELNLVVTRCLTLCVLKTARTIITVRVNMPENKDVYVKTLFLTKRQKTIEPLFKLSKLGLE